MIPIFQRNWYSECIRLDDGNLLVQVSYLDTNTEKTARIYLTRGLLTIYHAEVTTYREGTKEVAKPLVILPEINGIKAFFGSGRPLREALPNDQLLLDMMIEAVGAIIEAEGFFYQETGFATAEVYDDYWDETYVNTCAYYSNLAEREIRFMDLCKYHVRDRKLFCRHQRYSVFQLADDQLAIMAGFSDAFHDMAITLKISAQERIISEATGGILRSPDKICRYSLGTLERLCGKPMLERSTAKVCGGADGCSHISHMVMEATRTLDLALNSSLT